MEYPDIVKDKIYYYLWIFNIKNVNNQYKKTWIDRTNYCYDKHGEYLFSLLNVVEEHLFNKRFKTLPKDRFIEENGIHNLYTHGKVGILPIKYHYSSGLNSFDGYKYHYSDYVRIKGIKIPGNYLYSDHIKQSDIPTVELIND